MSFDLPTATDRLRSIAAGWLASWNRRPIAVVLGSGLGGLADSIVDQVQIAYQDIPGLAGSTAAGHRGAFLMGRLEGSPIIAMAGRLHAYEGHSVETLTRPMAVMASLQPRAVVVTCAAGGLNPRLCPGDLVIIDEHMSLLHGKLGGSGSYPGNETDRRSGRPTCDGSLAEIAHRAARSREFALHRGSYLAVTGPAYETRAECRMMRGWGFDLVGMSTVPEVTLASGAGLPTLAIGVVTNMAVPDAPQTTSHEDVLAVSSAAGARLEAIVRAIAQVRPA